MKFSLLFLFGRSLRIAIAERAAYRGDFFISFFVSFFLELITPLVTLLIYRSGTAFPGWNLEEVLLLQATFLISRGIAFPLFFGMVWIVFEQSREGTFEITLLKPRSPLLLTIIRGIDIEGFSKLFGGILLLIYTLSILPSPEFSDWILFFLLLVLSVTVLFTFALILSSSLFIWIGNGRLFELLESVLLFSRYPGSIFSSGFQLFFSIFIPLSMIAIFPAEALLGRRSYYMAISLPAVFLFLGAGYFFWNRMIRRYSGGGG